MINYDLIQSNLISSDILWSHLISFVGWSPLISSDLIWSDLFCYLLILSDMIWSHLGGKVSGSSGGYSELIAAKCSAISTADCWLLRFWSTWLGREKVPLSAQSPGLAPILHKIRNTWPGLLFFNSCMLVFRYLLLEILSFTLKVQKVSYTCQIYHFWHTPFVSS